MDYGHTILHWEMQDHHQYQKSYKWYAIVGGLVLLLILYGIISQSIMMSITFLVFAGVYFLVHQKGHTNIEYKITTLGIMMGKKFFPYADMDSFYIVHEPPYISVLNIILRGPMSREITIHLDGIDPADVREIITHRGVKEKVGKKESLTSIFSRILGL